MVTVAARDEAVAREVQHILSTPVFRCYRTTDVIGRRAGCFFGGVIFVCWGVA